MVSLTTRMLLVPLFVLALASTVGAQQPMKSAWLGWVNLSIAIAPDSGGTYLWVLSGNTPGQESKFFGRTFDPSRTIGWIADARDFLSRPLTAMDSGTVRSSPVLLARDGSGIYVARRQVKGNWSRERILVLEPVESTEPVLVNGDERSIGEILDSLKAVALRTTVSAEVVTRDSLEEISTPKPLKPATANPRNSPPRYPQRERSLNEEGTVLLSFVIGVDGRAERQSVKVVYSAGPGFLKAVLEALPTFTFYPATHNGAAVSTRVIMPFTFSLFR